MTGGIEGHRVLQGATRMQIRRATTALFDPRQYHLDDPEFQEREDR